MISKRLVDEVHKEAAKLRMFATDKELERLDIHTFDPLHSRHCIYGQMTGDCTDERAIALLTYCALAIKAEGNATPADIPCDWKRGKRTDFVARSEFSDSETYKVFSPIEVFIADKGADNSRLIDYLKGTTDTLDLSHTINC